MGQHLQPQRVPAAARRLRLHLHAAQPQLPPPPPLLLRRRARLPARPPPPPRRRRRRHLRRGPRPPRRPRRRRLPQCGRAVLLLLRPRRRPRAPRRRGRPHRARARDVPRPRRLGQRRRRHRPPEEAHDQEPRVRGAFPSPQAGLRPRAGEGGEAPAAGEPEPPRQVRAAEDLRGGTRAVAGEEDAAEDALSAILTQEQRSVQERRSRSSFLVVINTD